MAIVKPVWVVLKRINSHFEALSQTVEAYANNDDAIAARIAMALKFQGTIFAVFELQSQETLKPASIVEYASDEI